MSSPMCHGCQQSSVEFHTLLCGHTVCSVCREKIITGVEATTPYETCYHKTTSALAAERVSVHDVVETFTLAVRNLPDPEDSNFLAAVQLSPEARHAFMLVQAMAINTHFPLGSNAKARGAFASLSGFALNVDGEVMTTPATTDCSCTHRIRCNTQLNSLVPHSQYLSSVPIDARLDPLQTQSRAIYPVTQQKHLVQQRSMTSLQLATSPLPASMQAHLLSPQRRTETHYLDTPGRSPRALNVKAHVPPTTTTLAPVFPTLTSAYAPPEVSQAGSPRPPMRPRRSSTSNSAASEEPVFPAGMDGSSLDEFGALRRALEPLEGTLSAPSGVSRGRKLSVNQGTPNKTGLRSRAPSMSRMARPTESKADAIIPNNIPGRGRKMSTSVASGEDTAPVFPANYETDSSDAHLSKASSITVGRAREYLCELEPRFEELESHRSGNGAPVYTAWAEFLGPARKVVLESLSTKLYGLPSPARLDAQTAQLFVDLKGDLDRAFRDLQCVSSNDSFPQSSSPEETYVLPSSVKAAERHLVRRDSVSQPTSVPMARSRKMSNASAPRPVPSRHDTGATGTNSWDSDSTFPPGMGLSSSQSTKDGDSFGSRARSTGLGSPYAVVDGKGEDVEFGWKMMHEPIAQPPQPFTYMASTTHAGGRPELQSHRSSSTSSSRRRGRKSSSASVDGEPVFLFPSSNPGSTSYEERRKELRTPLHRAPPTADVASRRLLHATLDSETMGEQGFPYQYRSERDHAQVKKTPSWKPKTQMGADGEAQMYFGEYMKVGDSFVPYQNQNQADRR